MNKNFILLKEGDSEHDIYCTAGSRQSIDELHPKALRDLDQKYKNPDSRFHRSSNLVFNPTDHGNSHPDRSANEQGDNRYNINEYNPTATNDNFDQHIEEMMRVIVAQGKLIYDQLQRFNDKGSSSLNSTLPTSPEKVQTQAQVHSPLRISKDCESTASSNYDSASTSTSNPPKREYHTSRALSKKKMGHARGDFIRHPKNVDSISKSLTSFLNVPIPHSADTLGTRSKSYDNYETIFPLTAASQIQGNMKNASNDELPISRLELSNTINSETTVLGSAFTNKNVSPFAASSGIGRTADSSSQSSELSTTSPSKTSYSSLEPRRNISIKQTVNSDFQIVDITNVHKDQQGHLNASSRLSERNEHDNSFSSSSASENATINPSLSIRGSGTNDRLNQSVDLMNLSVVDNEKDSANTSLYGYTTHCGKSQGNANSPLSQPYSHPTKDVDIRFQRDKLILKTIHSELTKLVQMNDKLAFAEDSVDRLQIAIRQVQDKKQNDNEKNGQDDQAIHPPNLSMSEKEAEEHIACAKEQLERLKVANDDASKVIEKNKGSIEDIDKRVKAGKAKLKHLEYDVNVIEKESRKLNKELEKVLKIEIGGEEDDCPIDNNNPSENQNTSKEEQIDATPLSDSLDISVCTEDVTIMSKISGSVDSSNTEDSVDSSTLFPELIQLERDNVKAPTQITSQYGSKEQIEDSKNLNGEKEINQTKLIPISSDIHRVGCFEDIRLAINGSPAGSGASSSGNSSDKSVRFSDTDLIHPHHEYTISSSSSLTPELPDLPDEPASRGSYTTAIKNGCNSSILSLLNKNANSTSIGKPILKQQRNGEERRSNGAGATGDVDTDNSDTGLSSLHSSSDEATYEPGTLV